MKIAIIGNGFDLRHKLKTSYSDFMESDYVLRSNNNLIVKFFIKMNRCNGWFDFEQDLLLLFEMLVDLKNSYRISGNKSYYHVKSDDFINSPETKVLYDTLVDLNLNCFVSSSHHHLLIDLQNYNWHKVIIQKVLSDYIELREALKGYLVKEVDERLDDITILNSSEIELIESADAVYTFNYTNLLKKYNVTNLKHVHGKLDDNIILGIPYSSKMRLKEFQHIFKISQSVSLKYNLGMIRQDGQSLDLYFVGLSFGESDHYYFQEIKDSINLYFMNAGKGVPYINFHYFYHSESSKMEFLNNLRAFLGEDFLTRFAIEDKIKFHEYVD